MNREKSDAREKRTHDGLLNDRGEKFFSFHTPVVPRERRELRKSETNTENVTDALTATYWG